jgi:hypothetical protein
LSRSRIHQLLQDHEACDIPGVAHPPA